MKRKMTIISASVIFLISAVCIFAPLFCCGEFDEQVLTIRNQSPSAEHWFGTDSLGRDIFLRVCVGGRNSLLIAFVCTVVTTLFGCLYGGVCALVVKLDKPLFALLDILVSIPDIILVLAFSLIFEFKGIVSICVAICSLGWCKMARLSRDLLKPLRDSEYVLQAKMFGANEFSVITKHLLPNIIQIVFSRAILSFSEFMFYESFLSYLGIGISPPNISWGSLIYGAQNNFSVYHYQGVFFCLFLFCTLIAVNCLGESLAGQSNTAHGIKAQPYLSSGRSETEVKDNLYESDILYVKDLRVRYFANAHGRSTVEGASLFIHKNEIVGLVGQSGCGKTTIARTLSGIVDFYGGMVDPGSKIYFNSKRINMSDKKSKRSIMGENGIALIHQNALSVLDPSMTIGKQLMECFKLWQNKPRSKKERIELANQYLKKVGISESEKYLKKYPCQLSGGIAQRVVIAMAIAMKPQLLICDEPTSSLDNVNQKRIVSLLKKLVNEEELSILFISHDMSVVKSIASRVLRMQDGKITESDLSCSDSNTMLMHRYIVDAHTKDTALYVEHLYAGYYGMSDYVVRDVSFKLKPGETLGILGESGCGKTTLVRSILKKLVIKQYPMEIKPSSTIIFKSIKKAQLVFQDPLASFDPHWTIGKSILESGCDLDTMYSLLDDVGLEKEIAKKRPTQISIGQCQRAAIARAISVKPHLLICDEPTSSMDLDNQSKILNLLVNLIKEYNMTCIFISHDPDVIKNVSDRVAVMYKGKIVEVVSTKLFADNSTCEHHPYTESLLYSCDTDNVEDNMPQTNGCDYYNSCRSRCDVCRSSVPMLAKIGVDTSEKRHHFIACHKFHEK